MLAALSAWFLLPSRSQLAKQKDMEPRLNIITLGVSDVKRSIRFYQHGLGFPLSSASMDDVAFFSVGGVVLALYPKAALAEDAQLPLRVSEGFGGMTLAHNVRTREEVDRILEEVVSAGATLLKPAQDVFWGGRSGYFADPDGYPWEVAWNPHFPLDAEGKIKLPK